MDVIAHMMERPELELGSAILLYGGSGEAVATFHPVFAADSATGRQARDVYGPMFHGEDEGARSLRPVIAEGRLLTVDQLASVNEMLQMSAAGAGGMTEEFRRRILPDTVLCCEWGVVAWWVPSHRRPLYFETGTSLDQELTPNTPLLHPPLVFVGRPGRLTVFALAENARPNGASELMRAPYFNLYAHGSMCPGKVPLPKFATPNQISAYEAAFWDSSFVHTNARGAGEELTLHPDGHHGLWREMAKSKIEVWPGEKYLSPVMQGADHLTLEAAINM